MIWLEPEAFTAWRSRVVMEHAARHLTHARQAALLALVSCLASDTAPTDAAVAAVARCSTRTVRRARVDAHELGLLTWQATRRIDHAGRWRRGANAYRLSVPTAPVCAPCGQAGRPREERKKESMPTRTAAQQIAVLGANLASVPTLAAIAARRMAVLFGRGGEGRHTR